MPKSPLVRKQRMHMNSTYYGRVPGFAQASRALMRGKRIHATKMPPCAPASGSVETIDGRLVNAPMVREALATQKALRTGAGEALPAELWSLCTGGQSPSAGSQQRVGAGRAGAAWSSSPRAPCCRSSGAALSA